MNRRYSTFGIEEPADVMASDIVPEKQSSVFTIEAYGTRYPEVRINVPGKHNVLNALAAFSAGLELGIEPARLIAGLGVYSGMRRRFQVKFDNGRGLMVVDDYAHHPSEVKATVRAAKGGWMDSRVVAIFQPHLFSRTKEFADEYGWALCRADTVFIADIYPAREKAEDFPGVNGETVAAAVRKAGGKHVEFFTERGLLFSAVKELALDGNLLLFMGAGDITHLATEASEFCRLKESGTQG